MVVAIKLVPTSLREANAFVAAHHRHSKPSHGHKFSVGLADHTGLIGVAIAGRPRSRALDTGAVLEVLRVCVPDGAPRNACSMLYGACCRAGAAMGYTRFISYTVAGEDGASLKAAGFRVVAEVRGQGWDRPNRARADKHEVAKRYRWQRD